MLTSRALSRLVVLPALLVVSSCVLPAGTGSHGIGVYVRSEPEAVHDYEAWLGRPLTHVISFFRRSSWDDLLEGAPGTISTWQGSDYETVFAVPLLMEDGGTLADGAAGAYDGHFRELARLLVEGGQASAVLRLGWEFNGDWFPWAADADPASFAAYWRRVVTVMRSVPGAAGLRFDWNPAIGPQRVPEAAYPGDAYVDFIGLDVYDRSHNAAYADPVIRWQHYVERPYGLAWHRDFAASHGKPMTFPEWGLSETHVEQARADNPYFVERMHAWITANNVEHASYFEVESQDGDHRLRGGRFPLAAEAFVRLFGA